MNREPNTTSARPSTSGPRSFWYSLGLYSRSASWMIQKSPRASGNRSSKSRPLSLIASGFQQANHARIYFLTNASTSRTESSGTVIADNDLSLEADRQRSRYCSFEHVRYELFFDCAVGTRIEIFIVPLVSSVTGQSGRYPVSVYIYDPEMPIQGKYSHDSSPDRKPLKSPASNSVENCYSDESRMVGNTEVGASDGLPMMSHINLLISGTAD